MSNRKLEKIADIILDESSSSKSLFNALEAFLTLCGEISGIVPDPTYDAWAQDSFLDHGVAINPQAAAQCVKDYQRSVMFIRGVYAAIRKLQITFPDTRLQILYAGCGPFATQLLPLLIKFDPGALTVQLLDIHEHSLNSIRKLVHSLDLGDYGISMITGDACCYQSESKLHLVIAETMQKALEQEPQFSVTANLAPQLHEKGVFIPERVEVELCLAHLVKEQQGFNQGRKISPSALIRSGERIPLGELMTLTAQSASDQLKNSTRNAKTGKLELSPVCVQLPQMPNLFSFDALIFTRVQVFSQYCLGDYEAEITLPYQCIDLLPLTSGAEYQVGYQLGSYPRFHVEKVEG